MSSETPLTDHVFRPSKRDDSCDFTYWQAVGPWIVCDYPESMHRAITAHEAAYLARSTLELQRGPITMSDTPPTHEPIDALPIDPTAPADAALPTTSTTEDRPSTSWPDPTVLFGPMVKPPWLSKTLIINAVALIAFGLGLLLQAEGVFHLSVEWVTALGIVLAVLNFAVRLGTNSAIAGTPAATLRPLSTTPKA